MHYEPTVPLILSVPVDQFGNKRELLIDGYADGNLELHLSNSDVDGDFFALTIDPGAGEISFSSTEMVNTYRIHLHHTSKTLDLPGHRPLGPQSLSGCLLENPSPYA